MIDPDLSKSFEILIDSVAVYVLVSAIAKAVELYIEVFK